MRLGKDFTFCVINIHGNTKLRRWNLSTVSKDTDHIRCFQAPTHATARNTASATHQLIRPSTRSHVYNDSILYTPCPEKNGPPKHVQITLWIENDSHYFSLYREKPSICNVYVNFHDNQSVHCWDIAFYKKMVENCRRQHCKLTHARNTYLRPPILTSAHWASAFMWFLHKQNKMVD